MPVSTETVMYIILFHLYLCHTKAPVVII